MIKKRITYTNPFTNQEVAEDHYFHISKADLVEMEMGEHGAKYTAKDGEELTGMRAKIQRIIDSEDGKAIMDELKDIVRRAYGKKEGERFIKSKEIADDFMGSEAFSQLFFELCTSPTAASDFINGVVPANLQQIAAEVAAQATATQSPTEAGETTRKEVFEGTGAPTEVADGHPSDTAAKPAPPSPQVRVGDTDTAPPEPTPAATTPPPPPAVPEPSNRAREIANATPENPVMLTPNELATLDSEDFKSGIATGRYKLS